MKRVKRLIAFSRLNSSGVSHLIVPIAVVLLVAIIGTYLLLLAHAATPANTTSNATTVVSSSTSKSESSYSYAGYGSSTAKHMNSVEGDFNVPKVNCTANSGAETYYWVGITNNYNQLDISQLLQDGVEIHCLNASGTEPGTVANYTGFWQVNGSEAPQVPKGFTVYPGDEIHAVVTYAGKSGKNELINMKLQDLSDGASWKRTETTDGAVTRKAAVWVAEANVSSGYPVKGTVQDINFSDAYANNGSVIKPISYYNHIKYIMNKNHGIGGIDTPTALTGGGTAFTDVPAAQ